MTDNTVKRAFGDIDAIEQGVPHRSGDRRHRAGDHPGRRRHHAGAGGILDEAAGRSATNTACCGSPTKCSAATAGSGRFYAFEHYGVVPDVTALAKSLGGGKAAVGAMIAKRDIYMKAYGTPKTAMIHAMATFGGIGEASRDGDRGRSTCSMTST